MNITSSQKISSILAIAFSVIIGLALVVFSFLKINFTILFIGPMLLFLFIIFYFTIFYTFNNLILKKIQPIFDTIDTLQMPAERLHQGIEDGTLLEEIEKKVMEWAKIKVNEIEVLKANEKYRKDFLGNVSHELKTPLFNIQGYISTLIDGGIFDKEINIKYLKRTDKNIDRLISIVQDLETITKLETGEHLIEFSKFDIVILISEVFDMQEIRAKRKKINLRFDKQYQNPIYVRADKKSISDVLGNLLINSIIYGKEGGYTQVDLKIENKKIFVGIEDNGIGIEKKYQARIFERFFRVDKSRSKIQGGTGLGLAIVKHIIEAHKQNISVDSKLGVGTKFTFSLEKAE